MKPSNRRLNYALSSLAHGHLRGSTEFVKRNLIEMANGKRTKKLKCVRRVRQMENPFCECDVRHPGDRTLGFPRIRIVM